MILYTIAGLLALFGAYSMARAIYHSQYSDPNLDAIPEFFLGLLALIVAGILAAIRYFVWG